MMELTASASSVQLVEVAVAVAALIAVAVWRVRRAKTGSTEDDEAYSGPEPTDAEVHAAEMSIRRKTTDAVQAAKRKARNSLIAFVVTFACSVPFLAGLPLNSHFRPWGQLLLITCGVSFMASVVSCVFLMNAWLYKRDMEKMLDLPHEPE